MQLNGNSEERTRVNFRERQLAPNPKSISCYKLPAWLIRSMEALLHTLPGVTAIRLTLMAADEEIGQLTYNLNGPPPSRPELLND